MKKLLEKKLPELELKVDPHIELRVRLLKRWYNAICKMITTGSGFRWNDQDKCVTVSKDIFEGWVKVIPKSQEYVL